MDTFTVRDLRERTGELIHDAEAGKISLITKHGRPVIIAVPFTEDILDSGVRTALAIKLFKDETISLEKAAKFASFDVETFIQLLGSLGIPVVGYTENELNQELKDFGQ